MYKLNKDILYLIFQELRNDKETLISSLTVNKNWCETIIPILWKNPWKYLERKELLLNVIISHLSDESRNNLSSQEINILTKYQKPFFNYISLCRHLNFNELIELIKTICKDDSVILIVEKEITYLFINKDTRFTHLYIPYQFNYQIQLIPGAKYCFSELEFLSCNTCINDDILFGLTELCKPIKELELIIGEDNNNYRIIKLVESSKKLFNVSLLTKGYLKTDEQFCKILEKSLIKHADTIQNFKMIKQPTTKILSSFNNLVTLELGDNAIEIMTWNYLEKVSLPSLQILKARGIPIKSLTSLIETTNRNLIEVNIDCVLHKEVDNERIIQIIYKNCPNLEYLKLVVRNCNILEFKNLLTNCQYLNGLYIIVDNTIFWSDSDQIFNWDYLFEILVSSSPTNLFKFKFHFFEAPKSESLKLFLDNWKGKSSMLLQTIQDSNWGVYNGLKYYEIVGEYITQGIVKKYHHHNHYLDESYNFEDFEWVQENS
ncbi:hypothetical protein RclHR1_11910003 [Rhizophagus clarus]|uniref:F-box domain-containing protein n=1 Tax=Rhizophagus clarus TaxID=94130 RepID=A0A2Z6Q5M7_9GLOM|nr:hypothetical protein RclHR1_11910003 [Rhizophagus clarus]GES90011.1 hypothetical protein GLOIN_2v1784962 [Rhizophagus clarus]